MEITIETNSRIDRDFTLNLNQFGQTVLTIGGKEVPFAVTWYEELICDNGWSSPRHTERKWHLTQISSLTVETEEQKAAKIAVNEAQAVVEQAKKSLQCAKDVLKNTGVR